MATLMLVASCGGGSTKKDARRVLPAGPTPVVAKEGEFRTVIPRGYTNNPSAAQYFANGPAEGGFLASVSVIRKAVSTEVGINTYIHRLLRFLRPLIQRPSHLEPLSVNGDPALAMDYFVTATGSLKGQVTHVRQVFVKHGRWVFFIRDITLPAQYAASLPALDEVLRNWKWL
jgi:hypothetical protein